MTLDTEKKRSIYQSMYMVQQWELGLFEFIAEGRISGFYHAGRGHEATEVGAVAALRRDDYLFCDHRGCGHLIAKGMDMVALYGDFLGNVLGSTRGLGAGAVHPVDRECGILGQSGTLGSGHVLAAGAALALQLQHSDRVVVNFFGDGAANRGTFHEAANVAGAWKLPVIFIVQNNGWAISVPVSYSTAGGGFAQRGPAYDMPGVLVDGMDPFAVYEAMEEAVRRARMSEGPSLIEARTVRIRGHYEGDPGRYRSDEEQEKLRDADPVLNTRVRLLADGDATEAQLCDLEAEARARVAEARERANGGAMPTRERIFEGLYVEDSVMS
jgi:pyruvate dehydrogenase E1 component alpha subunit